MAGEQNQEPAWLAQIADPALREQAKKEFLLNADYTKKTQELAEKERAYQAQLQKLQEWEQFGEQMAPHWGEFKVWRDGKVNGRQAAQQQQAPANQQQAQQLAAVAHQIDFSNWEYLPEQEKVNRILGAAQMQYEQKLAQTITERERLWGEAIGNAMNQSRTGDYRYWNLVTDALEKKIENPKLPLRELLKEAMTFQQQIAEGKVNPLDFAYRKLTAPDEEEQNKQKWMKLGEEEHQRKLDAQRQEQGVRGPGAVPILKEAPKKPDEIAQAVRAEAEKAGIPWLSQ